MSHNFLYIEKSIITDELFSFFSAFWNRKIAETISNPRDKIGVTCKCGSTRIFGLKDFSYECKNAK